ncbi:uncharacterized protein [Clytia hemisphaerica]|uniref:Uncharacterized protein n=1 Tax=Clytia hemisphaerica TaxID=252671 RepID=A0A7M5V628_9CNID
MKTFKEGIVIYLSLELFLLFAPSINGNILTKPSIFGGTDYDVVIDPLCSIDSNGVIDGKISPQTDIIKDDSSCIFKFYANPNREVTPVQKGGDENVYIKANETFIFTRSSVLNGQDKGRAEMNFCFTKASSPKISEFNSYQLAYLAHTKRIVDYCDNAVHTTSKGTKADYGAWVLIPNDTKTTKARSVIFQWHGRPNGLVYQDSKGVVDELDDALPLIKNSKTFQKAIKAYMMM